jgi:hypothetical protein
VRSLHVRVASSDGPAVGFAPPGGFAADGSEVGGDLGFTRCHLQLQDKAVEEFFGQLWLVPPPPCRYLPGVAGSLVCWVRKELVEANCFSISDCYVAAPSDLIRRNPKVIRAPQLGKIFCPSFAEVVRAPMAGGAPSRGRGRGFALVRPPPQPQ